MLPAVFLLICGFTCSIVFPSISYACSCAPFKSLQEEFLQRDSIFTGKVINVDKNIKGGTSKIKFEIIESYKGIKDEFIDLTSSIGESWCGITFTQNEEYLVYAYYEGEGLGTNSCTPTKKLSEAEKDILVLEEIISKKLDVPVEYEQVETQK